MGGQRADRVDVRQLALDAPLQFRCDIRRVVEGADRECGAVGSFIRQRRAAFGAETALDEIRRAKFLRRAACPSEFGVADRDERGVEISESLLAHPAMTNGGVAQASFDAKANGAALASAGMCFVRHGLSPSPFRLILCRERGAMLLYVPLSGSGVQMTCSMRSAPDASITSRSKPRAQPDAGGIAASALRKSSSIGYRSP